LRSRCGKRRPKIDNGIEELKGGTGRLTEEELGNQEKKRLKSPSRKGTANRWEGGEAQGEEGCWGVRRCGGKEKKLESIRKEGISAAGKKEGADEKNTPAVGFTHRSW